MWAGLVDWIDARRVPIAAALGILIAWCLAEYLARRSTWQQGAPRKPSSSMDHGTYPVIALAIAGSLAVDLFSLIVGWTAPPSLLLAVLGVAVAGAGLAIRGWALRTLGRFFTMPITIAPDHRIVRDGPYMRIRHPAYTGGFLTVLGLPVALGSWEAVAATVLLLGAAYVYRISREEAALVQRFGEAYREYAAGTYRLIPCLY